MYAVMTVLPVRPAIPPEQVLLFVEEIRKRLTVISLDEEEYFAAIGEAAQRGFTSGRVYNALLLRCASEAKAQTIFTRNLKHFRTIAPEVQNRVRAA